MSKTSKLTHERLKELLGYNPETGEFRWLVARGAKKPGDLAGSIDKKTGYVQIGIDGCLHFGHRLAWFYVYGVMPSYVDHENRTGSDNRLDNLRAASQSQNGGNSPKRKNNKSGFKGVSWDKKNSKWEAFIRYEGKSLRLGRFATPEAAHAAYCQAAKKLFGEFARAA